MPKWGLTPRQRKSKPWELPERELEPSKTITDPIHGDICITRLEQRFLDSPPLQRLRRIRQLGTTHLVYPGGTHSRLSHALGALRSAQDLLDAVLDQRNGPHPIRDLFQEWPEHEYDRNVAEATVLARLGALLHDMCHVPFGHSIEDDLGILEPHDKNTDRFEKLWGQLDGEARKLVEPDLKSALVPLILSKLESQSPSESATRYPFVADIVGNTICADLIDYLQRDHRFAGLPLELGRRFLDGFYVTPSGHPLKASRMVIQIRKNSRLRADVVSELLKHLRYRYELSERVLAHHTKLAADAMVGKLLEIWRDSLWNEFAAVERPSEFLQYEHDIAELRCMVEGLGAELFEKIDERVTERIEHSLLTHGDDGFLEYVHEWASQPHADKRRRSISLLAQGLLNRELFKPIGWYEDTDLAEEFFHRYGKADARRELEESIAESARLKERWYVVLWVPDPKMRLKAAEVLVDNGDKIVPLHTLTTAGGRRGHEISQDHKALWSLTLFAHPSVAEDGPSCERIRALLRNRLGVSVGGSPTSPAPRGSST